MTNFNHLGLKGLGYTDADYAREFDIDESLIGTPEINRSFLDVQDNLEKAEKSLNFLYALNGLREDVKQFYKENDK